MHEQQVTCQSIPSAFVLEWTLVLGSCLLHVLDFWNCCKCVQNCKEHGCIGSYWTFGKTYWSHCMGTSDSDARAWPFCGLIPSIDSTRYQLLLIWPLMLPVWKALLLSTLVGHQQLSVAGSSSLPMASMLPCKLHNYLGIGHELFCRLMFSLHSNKG